MIPLKQFALAGNATFTVSNTATGNRFTFKVSKSKNAAIAHLRFVSVLVGPDNWLNYKFFGTIFLSKKVGEKPVENPEFRFSKPRVENGVQKGAKIGVDAPSVVCFTWLWNNINALEKFKSVQIRHAGKCCRCGRKLTVPESIDSGVGAECASLMGLPWGLKQPKATATGQFELPAII